MMKLIWLDLETTGLDPREDQILEVYAAEADLSDPFMITRELVNRTAYFGSAAAAKLERDRAFVHEMHTKNGLLNDCLVTWRSVKDIERELLELVPIVEDRDELPTLAGSTVHFDLNFLRVHMPTLAARLHYRVFDVSSIKLLARALGAPKWPKAEAHRAREDVFESIDHGRAATDFLLFETSKMQGPADPFAALKTPAGIFDASKGPR